ncbi:hypothetical protein LT493_17535 [Streptomyces tricolor]|nr:hypothetical protein [Streptomyces tricolor]
MATAAEAQTGGTRTPATTRRRRLHLPPRRQEPRRPAAADRTAQPVLIDVRALAVPLAPATSPSPSAPPATRPAPALRSGATGIGTGFLTLRRRTGGVRAHRRTLARLGHTPQARLFSRHGLRELPLPPAALAAGLARRAGLGDEFRHPALAADRGTVPRRLGLLTAKLLVSGAAAVLLAFLTVGLRRRSALHRLRTELTQFPRDWLAHRELVWLVVGCAWAGALAAECSGPRRPDWPPSSPYPRSSCPLVHKALQARRAAGGRLPGADARGLPVAVALRGGAVPACRSSDPRPTRRRSNGVAAGGATLRAVLTALRTRLH